MPTRPMADAARAQSAFSVSFPIPVLLRILPEHLKTRVVGAAASDMVAAIPVRRIVTQLAEGGVTLTFGELRNAVPAAFTPDADADAEPVNLPLSEVLPRVDPRFLQRREQQQKVVVPDDCTSPFELAKNDKVAPQNQNPASEPPPPAKPKLPPKVKHGIRAHGAAPKIPKLDPPGADTAHTVPLPSQRVSARDEVPNHVPITPVVRNRTAEPASKHPPESSLLLSLSEISASWPEALRREIQQFATPDALLALPMEVVAPGLKEGRIAFRWKALRGWITPTPAPVPSIHDQEELELPLKDIASKFLVKRRSAKATKAEPTLDQTIPDLFSPSTPPEPIKPAAQRPVLEPVPIPMPRFGADGDRQPPQSLPITPIQTIAATEDTSTGTRSHSPDELVFRAVALEGVAGAIIALSDGLPVASRLPRDFDPEIVAAVLPQMFARLSEYTDELRLGKVDTLEFTSANTPWRLFRVKNLFFAALAHRGSSLPSRELTALAQEMQSTTE